jgi:hypothetical protein
LPLRLIGCSGNGREDGMSWAIFCGSCGECIEEESDDGWGAVDPDELMALCEENGCPTCDSHDDFELLDEAV